MNYSDSGVDITKNDEVIRRIKRFMGEAGARIGHFGGAIPIPEGYRAPLLVSSIDSVGTKVMVAKALKRFDTIGRDIVHHAINDIACCGAEPLAFLDYFATSELDVDRTEQVVKGVIEACDRWNVTLAGGETAEMPGVYAGGEFDLVGAIYGVVERDGFIDGSGIDGGDVMLGFPSNGLHTNGYSLARRVVEEAESGYATKLPGDGSQTVGEALLAVHTCYLDEIRFFKRAGGVKGIAHITGGGLAGNVSRLLKLGLNAQFDWGGWPEPPIFNWICRAGTVPERDMRSAFNLGVGLVAVLDKTDVQQVIDHFADSEMQPVVIGRIVA